MNKNSKLLDFREISRRLEMSETGLGRTRIPKKYKEEFETIYLQLEEFIKRLTKIKSPLKK
jgi:hypothetical protein